MADAGGDCASVICGGCCLVFFSALTSFCNTKKYGSGSGSGRNAGCCDSCCRSSFDEDAFDAEVKKDMAKTRDPNAQPAPTVSMSPVPHKEVNNEKEDETTTSPPPNADKTSSE